MVQSLLCVLAQLLRSDQQQLLDCLAGIRLGWVVQGWRWGAEQTPGCVLCAGSTLPVLPCVHHCLSFLLNSFVTHLAQPPRALVAAALMTAVARRARTASTPAAMADQPWRLPCRNGVSGRLRCGPGVSSHSRRCALPRALLFAAVARKLPSRPHGASTVECRLDRLPLLQACPAARRRPCARRRSAPLTTLSSPPRRLRRCSPAATPRWTPYRRAAPWAPRAAACASHLWPLAPWQGSRSASGASSHPNDPALPAPPVTSAFPAGQGQAAGHRRRHPHARPCPRAGRAVERGAAARQDRRAADGRVHRGHHAGCGRAHASSAAPSPAITIPCRLADARPRQPPVSAGQAACSVLP